MLLLDPERRAELVESAVGTLYRSPKKSDRDELLSLVQTIMRSDTSAADRFRNTAYVVCDRHLVIQFVNEVFLQRSRGKSGDLIGRSLYYERAYEGTQIEQLYSMVMETRLVADALVRYAATASNRKEYDGWFVIVVIPLEDGGIGILSRFAKTREEIAEEIDPSLPDAPRFIELNS